MPSIANENNERMSPRVPASAKAKLIRAAALRNTDLTNFVTQSALREADAVIEQAESIKVSERDFVRILQLLENPPSPNEKMPAAVRKGLGRHDVSEFRLTRLAVDRRQQGKGMGGQLMLAAGRRCLRAASEVGGVILAIDAKNDRVAEWYKTSGAIPLVDSTLALVIPLTTMAEALNAAGHTL